MKARIYEVTISHARSAPLRNVFRYRSYLWLVDLDHLPRVRLLAGFRARDHLGDPRASGREDVGAHYAETLRIWRERFGARADEVARLGFDEVFNRMWTFYLCYSEAGFRAGYIDVSQLTLARTSA